MSLVAMSGANAKDVTVEVQKSSDGAPVTRSSKYQSHVTLYIENADGTKTPSGWSTRVSDGAAKDSPFAFQPGVGLIEGWTEGVLQMKEGERSWLHVPSEKGYGARPMGSQGGAFRSPSISAQSTRFHLQTSSKLPYKHNLLIVAFIAVAGQGVV